MLNDATPDEGEYIQNFLKIVLDGIQKRKLGPRLAPRVITTGRPSQGAQVAGLSVYSTNENDVSLHIQYAQVHPGVYTATSKFSQISKEEQLFSRSRTCRKNRFVVDHCGALENPQKVLLRIDDALGGFLIQQDLRTRAVSDLEKNWDRLIVGDTYYFADWASCFRRVPVYELEIYFHSELVNTEGDSVVRWTERKHSVGVDFSCVNILEVHFAGWDSRKPRGKPRFTGTAQKMVMLTKL